MTAEDSRKIGQMTLNSMFINLSVQDQLALRDKIHKGTIKTYAQFLEAMKRLIK